MRRILLNAALFQLGWFACVLSHNSWGVAAAAVILAIHARWVSQHRREWVFIAVVTALGAALETAMIATDIIHFNGGVGVLPPLWLVALWLLFASTLCHALRPLLQRPWLGIPVAAVGGPLTYYAGVRFGAGDIPGDLWLSLLVMGVAWGLLMPVFQWLAQRLVPAIAEEPAYAPS